MNIKTYQTHVANVILRSFSEAEKKMAGLTVENIISSLSYRTNEHGEHVMDSDTYPCSISDCWENGDSIQKCVDTLLDAFKVQVWGVLGAM